MLSEGMDKEALLGEAVRGSREARLNFKFPCYCFINNLYYILAEENFMKFG